MYLYPHQIGCQTLARLAFLVLGLALVPGCGGGSDAYEHVYTVRGRVIELPDGSPTGGFYVYHEAIPDYVSMNGELGMPAMAMPFPVQDASLLDGLAAGDEVEIVFGQSFNPKVSQGVVSIKKLPAGTVLEFDRGQAEEEPGEGQ